MIEAAQGSVYEVSPIVRNPRSSAGRASLRLIRRPGSRGRVHFARPCAYPALASRAFLPKLGGIATRTVEPNRRITPRLERNVARRMAPLRLHRGVALTGVTPEHRRGMEALGEAERSRDKRLYPAGVGMERVHKDDVRLRENREGTAASKLRRSSSQFVTQARIAASPSASARSSTLSGIASISVQPSR